MNGEAQRRLPFSRSKRWSQKAVLAVCLTFVLSLLAAGELLPTQITPAQAKALDLSAKRLAFNDADVTNCYYRNQFFGKNVRAAFALFDAFGTIQIDPPAGVLPYLINRFAIYGATPKDPNGIKPGHTGAGIVKANCDNTIYEFRVDSSKLPSIALKMPNLPPTINTVVGLTASLNGLTVSGVSPGTTVTLQATATDTDILSYTWAANTGKIKNSGKKATKWTLPNSPGIHFAYVLVSDGRGGYREDSIAISTDRGTVFGSGVDAPESLPSDRIRTTDHFLNIYSTEYSFDKGADSALGSCLYYKAIGVVTDCSPNGAMIGQLVDFASWKTKWGFFASHTRAVYANVVDLNLQRDMHGTSNADGTAFYVCNSPNSADFSNLLGARKQKGVVACVAMEYSEPVGGGTRFTKFITFGPDGKLLQSVNLDGKGEKYLPGSCVVCHGSTNGKGRIDEILPVNPNLGASFLPFDLDSYEFSTKPNFTRTAQEPRIKKLNQLVLTTNPTPPVIELINGWYAGTGQFDGTFLPVGWTGNPDFYNGVFKQSCRMCHVNNNFPMDTLDEAKSLAPVMAGYVCGSSLFVAEKRRYAMPNAKTTFDRFWNNVGGIEGQTQAQRMLEFINANIPAPGIAACNLPRY